MGIRHLAFGKDGDKMAFNRIILVVLSAVIIAVAAFPNNYNDDNLYLTQEDLDRLLSNLDTSNTRSDVFLRALNFPEIRQSLMSVPSLLFGWICTTQVWPGFETEE